MIPEYLINLVYIFCSVIFILGLKMMSRTETSRPGNLLSSGGMLVAVIITLLDHQIASLGWILAGMVFGSFVGVWLAIKVPMTRMPEMVALLNGFGGLSSLLLAWGEYHHNPRISFFTAFVLWFSVIVGGITFTGSMVAYGKLNGILAKGRPLTFSGQKFLNGILLLFSVVLGLIFCLYPGSTGSYPIFIILICIAFTLGILAVNPIGGADMPVVISLLNSYSGVAACAAGFVVMNHLLIVAGALVGASGIILTIVMCKSMNRSLSHVLFSGFGAKEQKSTLIKGEIKSLSPRDAYYLLEAANSVVIVPGYGLAVSQAQHAARELGDILAKKGSDVRYAIHPVAGRMPGHMNVLLAEANVSYDQLAEMDAVNPTMNSVDVCLVLGANDVVNMAAKEDKTSAIYGMPIINVDEARTVLVFKRSTNAGFSGIDNPLFYKNNTRMIFGDAKTTLLEIVGEFKTEA